ncbi:MAG: ABC transporter permease [Dehalococcoidia bacterium]
MRPIIRTLSFFVKWLSEIARQPALMLLLVVGPFLVLLAFGRGVEIGGPKPRTIVVRTGEIDQPIDPLPEELSQFVDLVRETDDAQAARADLLAGRADAVLIVPRDPLLFLDQGQHVPLQVLIGEIDPVRASYARAFLRDQVATLNQQTIAKTITEAQATIEETGPIVEDAGGYLDRIQAARGDIDEVGRELTALRGALRPLIENAQSASSAALSLGSLLPGLRNTADQIDQLQSRLVELDATVGDLEAQVREAQTGDALPATSDIEDIRARLLEIQALAEDVQNIPAEVLSAPFELDLQQATPANLTFSEFYAPAVLALLIQHLSVSVAALSMSRTRLLNIVDLLRVAPVRASEVVVGHYLSYGTLALVVGFLLLGLMIWVLGVPVFGSWLLVLATIVAVTLTSLGIGFVTSLVTRSDQQATQVAMLFLLASIFFSGFAFSLDRITWPVRAVSYVLPSTYGIRTLQDVMLRGSHRHPEDLIVLAIAGAALMVLTMLLYRREVAPR